MLRKTAQPIAEKILESLTPFTDHVFIAGSIRREKDEVKDIEILCVPKIKPLEFDLWGNVTKHQISEGFRKVINDITVKKAKGQYGGKQMQILLKEGINLDLFTPRSEDFFRHYATRTGSSKYSEYVLAAGWKKIGWVGIDGHLRQISECVWEEDKWRCINKNPTLPPVWQSEEEFFDWLKVKWIKPSERNV